MTQIHISPVAWSLGSVVLLAACSGTESSPGDVAVGGVPSTSVGGAVGQGGAATSIAGGAPQTTAAQGGVAVSTSVAPGTGGIPGEGTTMTSGGSSSVGGSSAKGGSSSVGGTSAKGGSSSVGGTSAVGGSTGSGTCDNGSSATTWASNCPTSGATCTAGTWIAGGPDPDHAGFKLCSESTHFAVYSDEACTASAQTAVTHLETVWNTYFGSPMYMKEPLCNSATKYKATVHVHSDWGLTGGAWTANRMGMWIGTGGLSDHWGLAHEFMHGVQSVSGGQTCNQSNTCGWVYESHANWAPQQLAEYHTSELHCSELLVNSTHLYLGNTRNRYCNWQFMEYLKDKYCYSAVNAIWNGAAAIDPFTAIRNGMKWGVPELNDFMGEWAMHNVIWDYQDPAPSPNAGKNQGALYRSKYGLTTDTSQTTRRLRTTKVEPLDTSYATNRRFISPSSWAPQRYGYNIIRLYPDAGATSVTVTFRGVTSAPSSPDWRWGLVATNAGLTTARYSALQKGSDAALTFCVTAGEPLFLVVTGTPSAWYNILWDQAYNTVPRYPYMFQLAGAWPEGFQNGAPAACPTGLVRATNGGGCAPSGTTAYVGPYATVLSGAVASGSARIEDHAIVARGTVSGGTVGALSLIGSGNTAFNVSSGTVKTTFYPLGFFASGQSVAGGSLIGDVEFQGGNVSRTSGTCSGYVDGSTCTGPGTDSTPAAPYTWRN